MPVAHEDTLAVAHVPVFTGKVQVRGVVGQAQGDGLGESARRAHGPGQHVHGGRAALLAQQPPFQHGIRVVLPIGHGHHTAVGQHHHDPGAHSTHSCQQFPLSGGQCDVGAVEPFRFPGFGQPQEQHGGVGIRRQCHRFVDQFRGIGPVQGEPGGETHRKFRAHLIERLQRAAHPGRHHVGGASALVAGGTGELADHGHRTARYQRQHVTVVLEQHQCLCRGLACHLLVCLVIEGTGSVGSHFFL